MLRIILIPLLGLMLAGCGYDGHYRYPCQDPANFGTKECIPPICEVTGQCTKDLLGFDPTAENIIVEEGTEEADSDIMDDTDDASAPKQENVDNINNMVDEISEGD